MAAANYDSADYPPFAVTVDVVVFTIRDDALQVLLVERGQAPFLGALALPGGFVRPDEDLDRAAARELGEETGVRPGSWHLEQLASYGAPRRDPRMRVVTVAYWAICPEIRVPSGGGDAARAGLYAVERIERGEIRLAFDHERIVRDAVERARSKLEYTALAARFCPPEFTISQLRRVFETVWDTRLDPGNFQRSVQERGTFERRDVRALASGRGRRASLWSVSDPDMLDAPLEKPLARRSGPESAEERLSAAAPAPRESRPKTPGPTRVAEMIAGDFYGEGFDLSRRRQAPRAGWSLLPEVRAVERLRALGAADRAVRVFLTLVSAMDRARDASRLWHAAAELFGSHPEAFDPDRAASMAHERLYELLAGSRVSQRHEPDSAAWRSICRSLASGSGAVCRVVDSGLGDVRELLKDLQSQDREGRPRYPMLRGPRVGPMWVRMMAALGGARIEGIESIPVAVDVQVRRATENLGVSDTRGLPLDAAKPVIQATWRAAVQGAGIGGPGGIAGTSAALDPALWCLGRYGCSHCERIGRQAPVGRACEYCRLPGRSTR